MVIDIFFNSAVDALLLLKKSDLFVKNSGSGEQPCWLSVVGLSILATTCELSIALLHQERTVSSGQYFLLEIFLARNFLLENPPGDMAKSLLVSGPPTTSNKYHTPRRLHYFGLWFSSLTKDFMVY